MGAHAVIFTLRIEVPPIEININHASQSTILHALNSLEKLIMSSKEEVLAQLADAKATIDATAEQNAKARAEIIAATAANTAAVGTLTQQVADLQAQIAAAGADVPPDIVSAAAALQASANAAKASAQALDDLNPDAPTA